MQGDWLKKAENRRCILLMAGWGMGPEPFAPLASGDFDLFLCYDYRTLTQPDLSWFSEYPCLELVAWSMGVWVAARLFPGHKGAFTRATAIGGTLQPIDDGKGVPVTAYDATLENLDQAGLEAFYASMFDDQAQTKRFLRNRPGRSITSVREELAGLKEAVELTGPVHDIFSHKIITLRDRIFPARNQLRAWGREQSRRMKWPHFPFYLGDCPATLFPCSRHDLPPERKGSDE